MLFPPSYFSYDLSNKEFREEIDITKKKEKSHEICVARDKKEQEIIMIIFMNLHCAFGYKSYTRFIWASISFNTVMSLIKKRIESYAKKMPRVEEEKSSYKV